MFAQQLWERFAAHHDMPVGLVQQIWGTWDPKEFLTFDDYLKDLGGE